MVAWNHSHDGLINCLVMPGAVGFEFGLGLCRPSHQDLMHASQCLSHRVVLGLIGDIVAARWCVAPAGGVTAPASL